MKKEREVKRGRKEKEKWNVSNDDHRSSGGGEDDQKANILEATLSLLLPLFLTPDQKVLLIYSCVYPSSDSSAHLFLERNRMRERGREREGKGEKEKVRGRKREREEGI